MIWTPECGHATGRTLLKCTDYGLFHSHKVFKRRFKKRWLRGKELNMALQGKDLGS